MSPVLEADSLPLHHLGSLPFSYGKLLLTP